MEGAITREHLSASGTSTAHGLTHVPAVPSREEPDRATNQEGQLVRACHLNPCAMSLEWQYRKLRRIVLKREGSKKKVANL